MNEIDFKVKKGKSYMLETVSGEDQTVFLTDSVDEANAFWQRMKNSGYDIVRIGFDRMWTMEMCDGGPVLVMSEAPKGTIEINGKEYDLKNVRRMTLHDSDESRWIEVEFKNEAPGYGRIVRRVVSSDDQYRALSDFLEEGGRTVFDSGDE